MNRDTRNHNLLEFECDWRSALNFKPGVKGMLGYLLQWNGCGLNLGKDMELWTPIVTDGRRVVCGPRIKCVGLIGHLSYEGGKTDPIRIQAYVSKSTASNLRAKLDPAQPLSKPRVRLAWSIIDFDANDNTWFEAAHLKDPTVAETSLDSTDGRLQISVDSQPVPQDEQPSAALTQNPGVDFFGMQLTVVPANKKKTLLEFASGPRVRQVKQWGTEQ
ncbi:hypothetical protein A176_002401 [Myxococcus hansupus]|uniref:Uncharacterized protein n=1 Tax=Pseudomyxococcus hansupus TaxID=1297742 RepID=A0A0H4WRU2_9BACT|nr:hypothetical protein [Myxococcus hansupus]AKQ65489.1 hypothetical protein A176_002401 [Myxococcus hansupus]